MRKQFFFVTVSVFALNQLAHGADFSVNSEAQLVAAINSINATAGSHTITFTGNVALTGTNALTLPPILNNVSINGGGFTLTGNANTRLLMVGTDTASATTLSAGGLPARPAVAINNLGLVNGTARGGSGAGGGMGAGGAIFVGASADVTVTNVNFTGNQAIGGAGATGISGGGGLGGNGASGGGGISGNGATGGGGLLTGATAGGGGYGAAVLGLTGTGGNGTAGVGTAGSTGGGFNPGSVSMGRGGFGGFGGGGGASGTSNISSGGGAGGFGGGGGVGYAGFTGGAGGFGGGGGGSGATSFAGNGGYGGGGGGSSSSNAGRGGFGGGGGYGLNSTGGFGGSAGTVTTGGGGAGFGGAIFVMQGGTISYGGSGTMQGGVLGAGTGAQTAGSGLFIAGVGGVRLTPGTGNTLNMNDSIADQNGLIAQGYAPPTGTSTGNERATLTISGPGTVNLAGTNIYSGGTIVENGAVLAISRDNNLGSAASTLTINNSTLKSLGNYSSGRNISALGTATIDNNGNTVAYSGDITGAGHLRFIGAGQTNLTGNNSFSGGLTISHSKVGVNSDANLGAAGAPVSLVSGGTVIALSNVLISRIAQVGTDGLQFDTNKYNSIWNGVISGTGALSVSNTGTLSLVGDSVYTGGTTVATGSTLALGTGTQSGSILGTVVNDGTLSVNNNNNQTITNNTTGTGSTAIDGTGVITMTGNVASTGTVAVNQGTLQLGAGGTTGTLAGAVTVAPTGTFIVNRSDSTTLAQPISGTGNFAVTGGGTTTLLGTNTFSGTTNINSGSTLQLGNGTTNGTISGNLVNNGTLVFDQATATTVDANISGTGNVNQVGKGTTTLTGTTTYTGTTTVSNGTLIVAGTLTGPLVTTGTGVLVVNGKVSGGIVGGNNTTINYGSTVTGDATTTTGNTLTVNGTITGAVTVVPNSTLVGSGTIGSAVISGIVRPGSSPTEIGTLTVKGPLTFNSTATAEFGITPTTNDRITTMGATVLAGTLNVTAATGTYVAGTRYTLIESSDKISGRFSETNIKGQTFDDNIRSRFQYNPKSTELILSSARLSPMLAGQSKTIQNLGGLFDVSGTVDNRGVLSPLYDLSERDVGRALNQYSGESTAGVGHSVSRFTGQFLNTVTDNGIRTAFTEDTGAAPSQPLSQLNSGFGQPSPLRPTNQAQTIDARTVVASKDTREDKDDPYLTVASTGKFRHPDRVIWGSLIGGTGQINANVTTGTAALSSQTYGMAGGITYRPAHNLIIGAALSTVGLSSSSGGGLGSTKGEGLQGAIYGRVNHGALYGATSFSLGWSSHKTDRTIAYPGFSQQLTGDTSAIALGNRTEIGYRLGKNDFRLTPFAAVSVAQVNQKGFGEKDSAGNVAGNIYSGLSQTAWRSELGLQFERLFRFDDRRPLTLKGQLAWGHLLAHHGSVTAAYAPIPTIIFAVPSLAPEKNYLLAGLSAEWHIKPQMQGFIGLNGEFASNSYQMQARIGLKSSW